MLSTPEKPAITDAITDASNSLYITHQGSICNSKGRRFSIIEISDRKRIKPCKDSKFINLGLYRCPQEGVDEIWDSR